MQNPIEEIKNRLDIVDVIGSYIKLTKTGANFRALCPFHSEKKPSFFVSPARQIWHCFGCGKGSDIFGFIKEIEGVEFGDALRILAQKAGVELKRQTPEYKELQTKRNRLYEICELATRFFEKQLEENKTGKEAKKYLLSRGINEKSIKEWRLGYSPDNWRGLSDFLVSKGYQRGEIEKAGLSIKNETGNYYDRFRGRIIFPVFDSISQVIGFGGRVFGEKGEKEIAKYLNTPNTLLYDKSRVLYGLDKTKIEIRKKNNCVLVEGYTDVIMSYQAGVENVVATSGTSLTPYQLKTLKRYSENLILGFDMDVAGDSATRRGIDLAQIQGFNIKVVRLPEGKDAAEIVSKSPEEWKKSLESAKSIMDFYFEFAFSQADYKTPDGKREISKILLPVIKKIPNKIEQSSWTQELAKRLEVREESIIEELKKVKLEEDIYGLEIEEIVNLPQKTRRELLEERLITLLLILKSPESLEFINDEELSCLTPKMQEIVKKIKESLVNERGFEVIGLSPELADFINCCYLKAEIEEIQEKDIEPEIRLCLKEIKCLGIKQKLDQISQSLKEVEIKGDLEKVEELTQEFNKCSKSLYDLGTA